jgi:hypothetical protein
MNDQTKEEKEENERLQISYMKAIDFVYEYYQIDHSAQVCLATRTSEPWNEWPGDLLTKEQFIEQKLQYFSPMRLAVSILFQYIHTNSN